MYLNNVGGNIFNLRFLIQRKEVSVCYGIENFHTAKEAKAGMMEILGALITAAVFAVFCKKIIKAFTCFKENGPAQFFADI